MFLENVREKKRVTRTSSRLLMTAVANENVMRAASYAQVKRKKKKKKADGASQAVRPGETVSVLRHRAATGGELTAMIDRKGPRQ